MEVSLGYLGELGSTDQPQSGSTEADQAVTNISRNRHAVMNAISITIAMIGLLGNLMVLVVIGHSKVLKKQLSSIFIISQSVYDILVSLFLMLSIAFPYNGGRLEGLSGDLWCQLWMTKIWFWSSNLFSTWNFVALTLERYLEVVMPIQYKAFITREKLQMVVVGIAIFGFLYNLIINLNTSGVQDGRCNLLKYWTSEEAQFFFGIMNSAIKFIIPCIIFTICYSRMAYFLHKRKTQVGAITTQNPTREANMEKARNNVLKTLIYVAVAYIICCSSNQTIFLLFNMGVLESSVFMTPFFDFTVGAYYANCMVNPFIYTFKYKQFQKSAKQLFQCTQVFSVVLPGATENPTGNSSPMRDVGTNRTDRSTLSERNTNVDE